MLASEIAILVVDDVNAVRQQIAGFLKSLGFDKVSVAASGSEAREKLKREEIHLLLCDWHMEPIDGLALLRFIRSNTNLSNTAFIMATAECTTAKIMEAVQSGIDDYILKPVSPELLGGKVQKALQKRGYLA